MEGSLGSAEERGALMAECKRTGAGGSAAILTVRSKAPPPPAARTVLGMSEEDAATDRTVTDPSPAWIAPRVVVNSASNVRSRALRGEDSSSVSSLSSEL